jgi:hypothetical protein
MVGQLGGPERRLAGFPDSLAPAGRIQISEVHRRHAAARSGEDQGQSLGHLIAQSPT